MTLEMRARNQLFSEMRQKRRESDSFESLRLQASDQPDARNIAEIRRINKVNIDGLRKPDGMADPDSLVTALEAMLTEISFQPSDELTDAYRDAHKKIFRSFLQRCLLSRRLDGAEARDRLESAFYAGLDYFVSNHLGPQGTVVLDDAQIEQVLQCIGKYLGSVTDSSRRGLAARVLTELQPLLVDRRIELMTCTVTASRNGYFTIRTRKGPPLTAQTRGIHSVVKPQKQRQKQSLAQEDSLLPVL